MKKMTILMLILSIACTQSVFAHAILVKSIPDKEAILATAPPRIDLWFDDNVGPKYTALAVVNSNGDRVDNKDGDLELLDKSHLSATLQPLSPGRYGVRYRVQSADGHIVTGKFFFQVSE